MEENEKWKDLVTEHSQRGGETSPRPAFIVPETVPLWFVVVILVLFTLLAAGEVYTYLEVRRFEDLGQRIEEQSTKKQEALKQEVEEHLDKLKRSYERQTRGMQEDVMAAASSLEATRQELERNRALTATLRTQQERRAAELAGQMATKADREQLGTLTQNIATTRQDLDSTRRDLQQTIEKLGMARSELGTLIARNHDEIAQLRKLGERDYYEFILERGGFQQRVGEIRLELKKTDVKRLRFTVAVLADDLRVEKKDRTINEPVFFYVRSRKKPLELVVNKVEKGRVVGYLSVPREESGS